VAKWRKQVGDPVARGDILVEIETDKATMELEAFESGVLGSILVNEGQTVPIGVPIALLAGPNEKIEPGGAAAPPVQQTQAAPAAQSAPAQAAPAVAPAAQAAP